MISETMFDCILRLRSEKEELVRRNGVSEEARLGDRLALFHRDGSLHCEFVSLTPHNGMLTPIVSRSLAKYIVATPSVSHVLESSEQIMYSFPQDDDDMTVDVQALIAKFLSEAAEPGKESMAIYNRWLAGDPNASVIISLLLMDCDNVRFYPGSMPFTIGAGRAVEWGAEPVPDDILGYPELSASSTSGVATLIAARSMLSETPERFIPTRRDALRELSDLNFYPEILAGDLDAWTDFIDDDILMAVPDDAMKPCHFLLVPTPPVG